MAQDSYLQHFYGNEMSFNPAFAGQRGALRLGISHRTQWGAAGAEPYVASKVVLEESLPCFFLDYGLFARRDEEGAGKLTTSEIGGNIAVAIPLQFTFMRRDDALNLRIGLGMTFGQRQIDFSRLTFLDQLDPFFGLTDASGLANPTGFVAPLGSGDSPRYSSPSLGVSLKGGLNANSDKPISFDVGLAVHNPAGLVSPDSRQTASLLGLDNALGERWVFSGQADLVVAKRNRRYWSLRPSVVYQTQEGLGYVEAGSGISWNRVITLGAYYHVATPSSVGRGVAWTRAQAEFGGRLPGTDTRLDVAFSYAFQHGFLKNYFRPPLELTATFSFGRSTTCALLGYDDESWLSKKRNQACFNFTTARNKLYDNIWYQENPAASGF
ncbi:MAG: type IX secretion system membrane protein PorP/SprF [Bacteroidota bacterium]